MNRSELLTEAPRESLEMVAADYAFLKDIKTYRHGFSKESNHKSFIAKFEQTKAQAYKEFVKDYEGMFKKYIELKKQYPAMLKQMQATESLEEMAYQKPNFEKVWPTVSNNVFVNSLGLDGWIEVANTGKDSKISKPSMDKVLDYDPSIKASDDIKYSHVNMPIILKSPMGDYHLLSGNAELNGIMDMYGNAKIWYVDASNVNNEN